MKQQLQKIILHIQGMHCHSCEILLEESFARIPNVTKSEVHYRKGFAEIYYSGERPNKNDLADAVIAAGYKIGETKKEGFFSRDPKDYIELLFGLSIVCAVYIVLKFFGITNFFDLNFTMNESGVWIAALVGLVAGFSSCMALVGGLVLGISARYAEKHVGATAIQKFRPHLAFNIGRVGGYMILGGLLGSVGSILKLSSSITSLITLCAGAVMLFVGLQLVGIFPRLSTWKFTIPKKISKFFGVSKHQDEYNYKNSLLVGALTFFLPCGFTQAMQVYAISSGNFISGAMIMGLFALGTAPGLLSIGGLTSALKGSVARKFFKVAGVIVIIFAILNISNSFVLAGLSVDNNKVVSTQNKKDPNVELINGVQVVRMTENYSGYSPRSFTIQKDIPVKWIIDAKAPYSCASSILMPKLGINKNLVAGENVIEFVPTDSGSLPFSCGMGMFTGSFRVVEKDSATAQPVSNDKNIQNFQSAPFCGMTGNDCGGRVGNPINTK